MSPRILATGQLGRASPRRHCGCTVRLSSSCCAVGYDSTGKPSWKRDAKQQLTEFLYDVYNRTTQILRYKRVAGADVLDPTQKTVYSYDSAVNGWGRLGSVSTYQNFADLNATGTMPIVESFEYTVAGLVSKKTLNVTGVSAVSVGYEWDNEGRPIAQKFPDMATGQTTDDNGPRFTWGYDSMGRLATMGQTVPLSGWAAELVSSTSYNAAGQMTQLVRPGGTENREYNVLGQLTKQAGLGRTVEYSYNATANDGRITKRKELSGEEVDYIYDSLGRLISAATPGNLSSDWGLSFTYDGFGNKTHQSVTKGSGPVHSYSIDVATNRITNPGFQYDANGNVTAGLLGLTGTYTYDVENRMVDNGAEKYGYGAGNRRLWKMLAGQGPVADVYFYGLGGEVLEVFRGSPGSPLERQTYAPTQRAWFGGRLIEKKGTAMNADRLGTYEKSFPYGELATAPTTSGEKFATYWRDAGTGLDYAVNRYYSPQMGRFLSADPYQASGGPGDPGSWNRYAYVGGDPVNYSDPGGLQKWSCDVNEPDFRECAAKQAGTQEFLSAGGGRAIGGAIFIPGFTAYWFATFFEGMPGASGGAPTKVPRRTYFLTVTKDCYEVPEQGAVTRNITYQLMFQEKGMPRAMGYPFAVIWEHLTGSLPKSGPDSPSSGPRGWFPDQQSVVNMTGITFMEGTQRFSAKWDNGREVGLPVYGFGGNPVELDIKRYMGYVSINGNIGGQVDPLTGRLIPGTYKPCD